jgi:hypothetical protein
MSPSLSSRSSAEGQDGTSKYVSEGSVRGGGEMGCGGGERQVMHRDSISTVTAIVYKRGQRSRTRRKLCSERGESD